MRKTVAVALVLLAAACKGDPQATRPGEARTTGANVVTRDAAIDHVIRTRCERAAACNQIGPDRKYTDRQSCERLVRQATRLDLPDEECSRGVAATQLSQCLADLREQECGRSIETIERLASCRTSALCVSE